MNAMPALKEKHADSETEGRAKVKRGVKGKKVIKLPVGRNKPTKSRPLTQRQKDALVIEFRGKARKLARSILRKWHSRLDLEEVDSVVDLSLCEAVRRFNPDKGASFITFLFYHLKGNLVRAVASAANANAIPVIDPETGALTTYSKDQNNGRAINAIEVAEALCNHEQVLPDEHLYKKELTRLSHEACESLEALEREVILGAYMGEEQLMDIAKRLGYSRCHISRVKRKALESLYEELKDVTGHTGPRPAEFDDEADRTARRPSRRDRKPSPKVRSRVRKTRFEIMQGNDEDIKLAS